MKHVTPSFQRGRVRPKRLGVGGFTLLEIMIVVAIVTILSWLAMVVIGRIRSHAAETTVRNNLRQIYQAKEFFSAETGTTQPISIIALAREGYISASFRDRVLSSHSFEANLGWHYDPVYLVNQPVHAKRGAIQNPLQTITYPGDSADTPPTGALAAIGTGTGTLIPSNLPGTATSGTATSQTVTTTITTSDKTTTPTIPGTNSGVNPPHGPGNSDFGHSHNQGHQGQSHNNPPHSNPPHNNPPHNNPPPKN